MTQTKANESRQLLGGDPLDLPFTMEEYRARLGRVHGEMAALDLDLLLVHRLPHRRFLFLHVPDGGARRRPGSPVAAY